MPKLEQDVGPGCHVSDSQAATPTQNQEAPSPPESAERSEEQSGQAVPRLRPTARTVRTLYAAQLATLRLLSCLSGDDPAAVSSILAIEGLLSNCVDDRIRRGS